ncbi:MAG: AmmeMemoRadiSam system protein A, partial [Thiovulaceae bacterium]|nr:AmmeMemoRadiSam system protein A [Sulfurimonadaceae bacterium]
MDTSYLLALARESIRARLEHRQPNISRDKQGLEGDGATFVTLIKQGDLRGCIGSIIAFRPLIDDVVANAQAAAFEDPRFLPLTLEELPYTEIEISILTKPQEVSYETWDELRNIIVPFEDGV